MSTIPRRSANHRTSNRGAVNRLAVRAALVLTLVLSSIGIVAAAPVSAAGCQTNWGSIQKSANGSVGGHLTKVRTGRHSCFDRLVIDLDGARAGYRVEYVDKLIQDGSGEVVPVKGGAILGIVAIAPAYDDKGSATINPATVNATNVTGYKTFRDIEWAGSFEGQTALGLGVRARLPFRVFTLSGPGNGSRLVIDVAHSWNTPAPSDDLFPGRAGDELGVIGVAHNDVLNVRSGAGVNHRIVARIAPTDSVFATGKAKMLKHSIWYEVSTKRGTKGWAHARYLAIPGDVDDVTAAYLAEHPRPAAISVVDLGKKVALDFAAAGSGTVTMSVGPVVGDLGTVTYDVVGLDDDATKALRLHIFAEPHDSGDGFELRTIEAQSFCIRGFNGTNCV